MILLFVGIGAGFVIGFFTCDHFRDKREANQKSIFREVPHDFTERN